MSNYDFFDSPVIVSDEIKKKNFDENEQMNKPAGRFASDSVLKNVSNKNFNFETEKQKIIDNLNWLKSLKVKEFTLRKKWEEICSIRLDQTYSNYDNRVKSMIWKPTDIFDEELTIKEILNLQPKMILVRNDTDLNIWDALRYYVHSAEYNQPPGRYLRFLLIDEISEKILGFSSIASDVPTLGDRDKYIGWTQPDRMKHKMLKYSAIGSTIAATQPFGSNFLGGKLMAAMIASKIVRDAWEQQDYGEATKCKLIGMTTTSLFGRPSMYDGMPWWHGLGLSEGKMSIQPTEMVYKCWHQWLKDNKEEEYLDAMTQKEGVKGPVTGAKMKILSMIFRECGITKSHYDHGFERGVYYSNFYENGREFLCRKITEDKLVMKPLFINDTKAILDWWKPKAIARYKKLKSENRLNPEKVYYSYIGDLTWEDTKEKLYKGEK